MNNNYAVGTDIVEVGRIRALTENHGARFFKHVFTEEEVQWCYSRSDPCVHLAGRFAAKEAVRKALMALGESATIPFSTIEVLRQQGKAPEIKLHCVLSKVYNLRITLSHTDDLAIATVIAEAE